MIDIVDRIGQTHDVGALVYAYFDTSMEKYIVLEKFNSNNTQMVYGSYTSINDAEGTLVVQYLAGSNSSCNNITQGSVITVQNQLGLSANGCQSGLPAVALRIE